MAFSPEEFRSTLNLVGGLASPSKFAVYITPPSFASGVASTYDTYGEYDLSVALNEDMNMADANVLAMLCDTATLPSKSLQVLEYRPQGFGKTSKMPFDVTFDSLQATFYMDNDHRVMTFLQYWMQEIINTDGEFEGGPNSTFKNRTSYELNYKKNYATTMLIQFYANGDENSFIEYEFHDVFPIQIGTVQLGWDQTDQIAKVPVEFTSSGYTIFRGSLGGMGSYGTRGVDFYQHSNLFGGNLLSALTDTTYGVRNMIESFTRL